MDIHTEDLICITNEKGQITESNMSYFATMGVDKDKILDYLDVEDREKVEGALNKSGPSYSVFIVNLYTRAGVFRASVSITRGKTDKEFCFIFRAAILEKETAPVDSLTKLPTRDYLSMVLNKSLGRVERNPSYNFGLLFIDLDGFKQVNDTSGHLVGDKLLQLVARKLLRAVRPVDTVIRYGGDEFIIVLDDVKSSHDIVTVSNRIEEDIKIISYIDDVPVKIGASIGFTAYTPGETIEQMIDTADKAMYDAKKTKKVSR